jgi:hypothetical protein
MSHRRFILLLGAALLVIGGAFYVSSLRDEPPESRGVRLFPGFAAELDSVSVVTVRKDAKAPVVTLRKTGSLWTVAQRDDYPADLPKIRKLLLTLGDAALIEEKTSNPANYAMIGVAVPGGTEVTVTARDGDHTVIIGKPLGNGNFARRPPEAKSYLIEPSVFVETEPRRWIDPHILDVAVGAIQRLEVTPAAGPGYSIHRTSPTEDAFALESAPPHRTALDPKAIAPSPSAFSALTADDVAPAPSTQSSVATLTLTSGAVIRLTGTASGDKHWLQVQNDKDEPFTARTRGRAFEIAGYRYDAIFRPLDQLLKPKL